MDGLKANQERMEALSGASLKTTDAGLEKVEGNQGQT
jgi:hypothetical protein